VDYAAREYEYVKYRVVMADAFPGEEHDPERVSEAAGNGEYDRHHAERIEKRLNSEGTKPSHYHV
jgi:hypothetical protein